MAAEKAVAVEPASQQLDPTTRLALEQLADIVMPPPVSWWPQTWGWLVLALVLLGAAAIGFIRWRRRYEANRYRREALADLAAIEADLHNAATRGSALAAMPELLKRVALAAWPREAVASLSGVAWIEFMRGHGGQEFFAGKAARLLDDLEYRPPATLAAVSDDEARMFARSVRQWIEGHVVPA